MADGRIQDNQISASSAYKNYYHGYLARLNSIGGWSSEQADTNEWIQVAFDTPAIITGVTTQGEPTLGFNEWVTAYKVEYSDDNGGTLQYVQDNHGNDAVSVLVKNILETIIK